MSERASLLALLRRLRRRLRLLAAADGAVRGAAVGLGGLALLLGVSRLRAVPAPRAAAVGLVVACVLAGAAWLALRRIDLRRCARLVDRALDGQDRVLSALSFVEAPAEAPAPGATRALAAAAVADALGRAGALAPAGVAPARRPRGLPGLAVAAVAALVCAALPARAPAARLAVPAAGPQPPGEPLLRIAANRLDAERDDVRRAAEAAAALGDEELAALAKELAEAVRALSDGKLTRGEALEKLQALAQRAAEGSDTAEGRREAVRDVGRALEESPSTRAAGAALAAEDAAAAERALGALAARAAAASASERGQVAKAMDAAAGRATAQPSPSSASAAGSSATPAAEQQRRLKREQAGGPPPGATKNAGAGDRRLERLRRDLADTAKACRDDPETCKRKLSERAGDLPKMAREAQRVDVWKRMQSAARQMRERLRRGDLGDQQKQKRPGEQRLSRSSNGQPGDGADDPSLRVESDDGDPLLTEGGDGMGGMETESDGDATGDGEGRAETPSAAAAQGAQGASAARGEGEGDGVGSEPGRDPLGPPGVNAPARGQQREARLRGGAGPTRSQVIEAAARRGFTHGGYGRVFSDYQAVVEEALESGAVPEGRRYVVRRYFQIIRPRAEARQPAGTTASGDSTRRP